jgi:peptidase M50-like protein/CBS domain protein
VVGPLTSFALAAVFWLVGQSLGGASTLDFLGDSPRSLRGLTPTTAILNYLTTINLVLGAFNLIPAFPLDGGRVFRSIVWGITQRFSRATTIAATVGQAFAFLMIGLGVVRIAFGDVFGGMWTILIGWFLNQAASAARQDRALREGLEGVPVRSVMDPGVPLVESGTSLQQLVYDYLLRSERRQVIAVEHGVPVGVVDASAVRAVPRERWPTTPVAAVSTGISYCVSPDDDAGALLRKLEERDRLVPVVADGVIVGAVDLWRLLRFAQLRRELLKDLQVGTPRPSPA